MNYPYAHIIEFRSYLLSMSVVFTVKYILVLSILMFSGNKERKNGKLNVVDVAIFSYFKKLSHTIQI